jgi:peptidoglycan/xylan/chitin deacetylase (PgdA/CDA1 family)
MTAPDERYYQEERYVRRPRSARLLPLFYRAKPLIPRRAQMRARRTMATRQRHRHEAEGRFPRWPIEPILVDQRETLLRERVRRSDEGVVPVLGAWPAGHRFAWILTHDVEGPRGLANVERLLELERRHGVVSAWFLVADDYPVEEPVLEAIRAAGCEIGLHGLHHDGSLFQSRSHFERQLPRVQDRLRAWGAEGFRSPATHRNAAWMTELGAAYDSSFPDTHPFDAQPGGCCSILPYFLGDTVELPITLPQDHTLFELLGERDIALWRQKVEYLAASGGLVTVLVHPDYALTPERLRHYDELLTLLRGLEGGWHALPRDVARWWRRRAELERGFDDGDVDPRAAAAAGASVYWATERDGAVVIEEEVPEHA